jgi:hypothetical protein
MTRAADLDAPALAAFVSRGGVGLHVRPRAALASSSIGSTDASGLLSPRAGREEIEPPPSPLRFSASNRSRGYRSGDGVEASGGDVRRRPAADGMAATAKRGDWVNGGGFDHGCPFFL